MTTSRGATQTLGDLKDQLVRDGVVSVRAILHPLHGGVSSDIYRVEDAESSFVVKRALPRLRVSETWLADVSRNEFEQRYLRYVADFLPEAVPKLLATGDGYFAMEYLRPQFETWKSRLLVGRRRLDDARLAGSTLGLIHARSYQDPAAARDFDCPDNFRQLRVEPYLLSAARRSASVAPRLMDEAERLLATREALVHGDFSPKNLLVGDERLVVVDCEVAWYGDPAFDVAFMTSHLLLKALHLQDGDGFEKLVAEFCRSYAEARCAADAYQRECDLRVGRLLPMLLLARVDGKSPVEYLDSRQRQFVRSFATDAILSTATCTSSEVCSHWFRSINPAA